MADEAESTEPPLKKQASEEPPNLLGPPYRWLLPDCRCFYSENLYVKFVGDQKIDRYFQCSDHTMDEAMFWAENDVDENYSVDVRTAIFQKVIAESRRRLQLSSTYRYNAAECRSQYTPLHRELFPPHAFPMPDKDLENPPDLAPGLPATEVFTPEFLKAWADIQKGVESEAAGLKSVHLECFQIAVFKQTFTKKLEEEIKHFKGKGLPHQWPNNMNRSGCILNEIGLGPLMDRLIYLYLGPLVTAVYPRLLSDGFESHHSFIVAYSPETDSGLGVHDDNSEVTVNIALCDDYDGASLALYHHARVPHPQTIEKQAYYWRVGAGTMLFHPGEMLHEVLPIKSGFRMGMIIWLRRYEPREAKKSPHGKLMFNRANVRRLCQAARAACFPQRRSVPRDTNLKFTEAENITVTTEPMFTQPQSIVWTVPLMQEKGQTTAAWATAKSLCQVWPSSR